MTSMPSTINLSPAHDRDIAAHQKAAEDLLRTCGKYEELSVFDVIFELNDGRYVSAKDGLTDIVEESDAEELPSYVTPDFLENCPASQDVIDGPLGDFKVIPALPTLDTLAEMAWPVVVTNAVGGQSFYGLALQVLYSKKCLTKWEAVDQARVRAMFEEEGSKLKGTPDSYSVPFIAMVGVLALHKTDGWVPSRSLLAAFAAIIATFPDFLVYVRDTQDDLARRSAVMLEKKEAEAEASN